MTKAKLLHILIFWFPMACVITMVLAAVVCLWFGMYRKGIFWALDAAITAWSAFMLN